MKLLNRSDEDYTLYLLQNYNATSTNSMLESTEAGPPSIIVASLVGLLFSIITLLAIVGNMLVILSIVLVRRLRSPSNYLLVSLAVSDLLVGIVVMPLSIVYYITGRWYPGKTICSMWVSFDVMLCTASILSLLAISVDRYLVITRPFDYARDRNWKHVLLYVFGAWSVSILTSMLPLMVGWNVQHSKTQCVINQDISYQTYATTVAFFGPWIIMCSTYGKIFYISYRLAAKDAINRPTAIGMGQLNNMLQSTSIPDSINGKVRSNTSDTEIAHLAKLDNNNSINDCSEMSDHAIPTSKCIPISISKESSNGHAQFYESDSNGNSHTANGSHHFKVKIARVTRYSDEVVIDMPRSKKKKAQGNRRAVSTLGYIMGFFSACWLPFFLMAVIGSGCSATGTQCHIPDWLVILLTWLGYANSALNPLIYAITTREFRIPFRELICCRWSTINDTVRHREYEYQYGRGS